MQASKFRTRNFLLVVALAVWVAGSAWPASAQPQGPGGDWSAAIDGAALAAASPPAGLQLRSLAVANIREARTQARWPLSSKVEQALAEAITRRKPDFQVLGHDRRPDLGATHAGSATEGHDAVLTGTFRRADVGYRFDLVIQDLPSQRTLYALAEIRIADAALPPQSLPSPGFGRLAIEVDPPGALVYVDGEPVGRGSVAIPAPLGTHLVTVAAEGFEVFDEAIDVRADAPAHVVVKLKRPSVTVTIDSNVPGARVVIDGADRGATPISLTGLAAGKHRVTVSRDGYRPYEAEFEWAGGKTQVVKVALAPIPGSLVVTSDVGDARVELDGTDAGRAPLFVAELAPGTHKVRVTAGDRAPSEQTVDIRSARTAHLRARLGAEAGAEGDYRGLAIVPRSANPDDRALALAVQRQLQERHPEVTLADPVESIRQAQALFPEEGGDDPAQVRKLAQTLHARQVVVIGAGRYEPFAMQAGVWPRRPSLKANLFSYQGTGPREAAYSGIAYEGGEPWLGSEQLPDRQALVGGLAANMADALAGKPGRPAGVSAAPLLLETASAFMTDGRAGVGLGVLYEVRYFDALEFGAGLAYANALGNDFKAGRQVIFSGAGNDLIYGVGQNHQLRVDALWRFDGPPRPRGPWFDGPRLAPYLGVGGRVNVPRYEVYGVNRKDSEGGFYATEPRSSLLGGTKVQLGGLVLRAEVEIPVVATFQDPAIPALTLAGGWLF